MIDWRYDAALWGVKLKEEESRGFEIKCLSKGENW